MPAGGLPECRGTGYLGRMGVYETMPLHGTLKGMVGRNADSRRSPGRRSRAAKPLRISGAQKVAKGLTTIEEVLRVTPSQDVLL